MPNPRTPLEVLKLTGSNNLLRAKKREAAERNKPPLSPEVQNELGQLDSLIQRALKACKRGQTFKGRRNAAFANLESLVKVRSRLLEKGPTVREKTGAEILAEANALFTPSSRKVAN